MTRLILKCDMPHSTTWHDTFQDCDTSSKNELLWHNSRIVTRHQFQDCDTSSKNELLWHNSCLCHWKHPKLQIIFHKRATKYRSLSRKMTYKDKGSYESSPPCMTRLILKCDMPHSKCTTRRISGSWYFIKKRVAMTHVIYMSSKTRSDVTPHSKAYLILKRDMPHSKAWNDSFQIRSWWHELLSRTRCYEAPSFLTNECRICESQVFLVYICGTQELGTRTCHICKVGMSYGVATISRLLKVIGLFCKRAL